MLTKKQAKAILAYCVWLEEVLELKEWRVTIEMAAPPDDEDALAETTTITGRREATIQFCKDFAGLDEEAQRHTVIHEMLHLTHEEVSRSLDPFTNRMSDEMGEALRESVAHACEVMVDQLARAWATELEGCKQDRKLMGRLRAACTRT